MAVPRLRAEGGGQAAAAVLPVPRGGRRPEADHHPGPLGARRLHAVDPRGADPAWRILPLLNLAPMQGNLVQQHCCSALPPETLDQWLKAGS